MSGSGRGGSATTVRLPRFLPLSLLLLHAKLLPSSPDLVTRCQEYILPFYSTEASKPTDRNKVRLKGPDRAPISHRPVALPVCLCPRMHVQCASSSLSHARRASSRRQWSVVGAPDADRDCLRSEATQGGVPRCSMIGRIHHVDHPHSRTGGQVAA
jgi:hypothetical protein